MILLCRKQVFRPSAFRIPKALGLFLTPLKTINHAKATARMRKPKIMTSRYHARHNCRYEQARCLPSLRQPRKSCSSPTSIRYQAHFLWSIRVSQSTPRRLNTRHHLSARRVACITTDQIRIPNDDSRTRQPITQPYRIFMEIITRVWNWMEYALTDYCGWRSQVLRKAAQDGRVNRTSSLCSQERDRASSFVCPSFIYLSRPFMMTFDLVHAFQRCTWYLEVSYKWSYRCICHIERCQDGPLHARWSLCSKCRFVVVQLSYPPGTDFKRSARWPQFNKCGWMCTE